MNRRVAIFQNTLTGGGRIMVVNALIRILNEFKIIPDVYTFRINKSLRMEEGLEFRIKRLISPIYGLYELKILALNVLMHFHAKKYDLLINSNNALLFAPSGSRMISYIHFPCEARITSKYVNLAFPDGRLLSEAGLATRIYRLFLVRLYKMRPKESSGTIITNSEFSRSALLDVYPELSQDTMPVIYPPIAIQRQEDSGPQNDDCVVTLGRFSADKRQLEQIQIAENLPNMRFQIIGFVGDSRSQAYFNKCKNYQIENAVKNVELHQNLPWQKAKEKLQAAKFFMHNLRNEPFGISTVEAIASDCIPLVHDSGGQREIVPFAELRFRDKEHAVELLKTSAKCDYETILTTLRHNIRKFDRSSFDVLFKKILTESLGMVN